MTIASNPLDSLKPIHVGVSVDRTAAYGRAILRGVMNFAATQRRWQLFTEIDETNVIDRLPRLDGLVVASVGPEVLHAAMRHSAHTVICSGGWDVSQHPLVTLDDFAVGCQAATHLVQQGLRHFAYYLEFDYRVSKRRLAGFQATLKEHGFDCAVCSVRMPSDEDRRARVHHEAVAHWLKGLKKPVGVLAFDDAWANDLAEVCVTAGIDVPGEVAVVGVNNDELLCGSSRPPLSSIETDYGRMGFLAASIIDRMLRGVDLRPEEMRQVLPPMGVVQRLSSASPAVTDPQLAAAIAFIEAHACDPCSVDGVLDAVPVGRRWLERRFIEALGRSPHDEITRVRIETAKRLLLTTDLRVTDIMKHCGYGHLRSLNSAFRKLTGMTPGTFRKRGAVRG